MTETSSSSSFSHLSVARTTTDVTQNTVENVMTSSSSGGADRYFQGAVLVIGIVGTATNALIIYAMIASKQHKKHVLIFNQNVLDCVSCVLMIITYSLKLSNIYVSGTIGYLLCALVLSEGLISSALVGSVINLAAITVERYLKIVHSAWSQNHLRNWMTYTAMAFSWLTGIIYNVVLVSSSYLSAGMELPSAAVIGGACYGYTTSESETGSLVPIIGGFILFYLNVLLIFIFCYWRILIVIRRQAAVMASHGTATGSSAGQTQLHQMQSSVIKTMILVCAFYGISWLPNYLCIFLIQLSPSTPLENVYHASVFLVFLYTATNPFIYVAKFDPVRNILLGLFSWKQPSEQSTRNTQNT